MNNGEQVSPCADNGAKCWDAPIIVYDMPSELDDSGNCFIIESDTSRYFANAFLMTPRNAAGRPLHYDIYLLPAIVISKKYTFHLFATSAFLTSH